jgi:hypothetical protein
MEIGMRNQEELTDTAGNRWVVLEVVGRVGPTLLVRVAPAESDAAKNATRHPPVPAPPRG